MEEGIRAKAAREQFTQLVERAGWPVWATWIEVCQARTELPEGPEEKVWERAYAILTEKYAPK